MNDFTQTICETKKENMSVSFFSVTDKINNTTTFLIKRND